MRDENANLRWMRIDTTPSKINSAAATQCPTRLPWSWNEVTVDLVIGFTGSAIEQNAVSGASVITTFRSGPSAVMLVILPIFMEGLVPLPNVSDQTPAALDSANTTDASSRLSASVLFVPFWLLRFFIGLCSVDILLCNPDHRKRIGLGEKVNGGSGKPEGHFTERQNQCVPASESSVLTKNQTYLLKI